MTCTSVVALGLAGFEQAVTSGTLAAFVNGEVRGVTTISTGFSNQIFMGTYSGANAFFLIMYADVDGTKETPE